MKRKREEAAMKLASDLDAMDFSAPADIAVVIRDQQKFAMERLIYVLDEPWVNKLLEGALDKILDEDTP